MSKIVGGGAKKILYTLETVKRIGLRNSAKALSSKNTCKACGLGMGGQHGGMTNELNEFPSVCNKSVQAQSTDIQPPIPEEIFQHSISELKELSGYQIEHLGRLNTPLYKTKGSDHFSPIEWERAIDIASQRFSATTPDRSFFYSSGRSSNEAAFVLQLLARLYGTNNVNNCSYYCHQASGVALQSTIGTGTSTISLADIQNSDAVFLIGANPASNHPRFIHQLKAVRDKGGKVIVINPAKEAGLVKFSIPKSPASIVKGGDEIASHYIQPKIGSDAWLISGIAKSIIENGHVDNTFIESYTNHFASFNTFISELNWQTVEAQCGINKSQIEAIATVYAQSQNVIFAWGMGVTHHKHGCENIEAIVNLALLRGMIGKPGAGLLPLRGHSNVQGIGSIGVKPVLAEDVLSIIEKEFSVKLPRSEGMDTLACLRAAHEGNIDAALFVGGNLFEASPNSQWSKAALNTIGFKLFLTTTLNKGHVNGVEDGETIILPVTARDEEWQPTTQESMFNFVRMSDGGIIRLNQVRPESSILISLAENLVPKTTFDFSQLKQHLNIREAIAKCIPGMTDLAKIDMSKQEFHIKNRILHTPHFQTDNKKANFTALKLQERPETNTYILTSVRSEGQFNSIIYEERDSYRGTDHRSVVFMNEQDISRLSIVEGDKIDIHSKSGSLKKLTVKAFDLPSGNLMTYYPEANALIGNEYDPRSKTPAFKSIEVTLVKNGTTLRNSAT